MGELYERIFDFENLYKAVELAARGKKYRVSVLNFFYRNLIVFADRTNNEYHPTEKPVALMKKIIDWVNGSIIRPIHGFRLYGHCRGRIGAAVYRH